MMATQLWWYTARASGVVAWMLLSASVVWGLALSTRVAAKRVRPNWMLDLHRFLGGTAVAFVAVHVGSLVLDTWVHFGPAEILVPFVSSYRASAVAWGVVGLYLLAAVEITSLLRRHLSKQAWRRVHLLSFVLFASATIHGLTAGTDTGSGVLRALLLTVAGVVAVLTALRVAQAPSSRSKPPRPGPARPAPSVTVPPRSPVATGIRQEST